MSRVGLPLPTGWRPGRNMRVEIHPHATELPVPPPGVWRVVDRSAGTPGPHWWVQPHDEVAREWARRHHDQVTSGCYEVKGLRLVPPGTPVPEASSTRKTRAGGRR